MKLRYLLSLSIILLVMACSPKVKETFHCGDSEITKTADDEYLNEIYGEEIAISNDLSPIIFPLKVVTVINPTNPVSIYKPDLTDALKYLNKAFVDASISFELAEIEEVYLAANIEDITKNGYRQYSDFSLEHDRRDRLTLFLFDDNQQYCTKDEETLSCRRTHGFSFILNENYLNVVLTKQDLINKKVLAHEVGHFFGLYHTFRASDGKELVQQLNCRNTGDHLCSTPADPGNAYEVYVDYTNCEMFGLKDQQGQLYKPMVNNYMSYFKPCYLKEFAFTREQLGTMRQAALSPRRSFIINPGI